MSDTTPAAADTAQARSHPRALEPVTLILTVVLSVLGAVIGLVLITTLGIAPNTSVIGALIAMLIGRLSFAALARMRDPHRQNLVQSAISGSTFAAANSLVTPIAVPFLLGEPGLVWPMLGGAVVGLLVDSWVLYRVFDSKLLPASAAWPAGIAAAETIKAGDEGGRKARLLGISAVVGFVGSLFKLPMSAAGVAFLGNIWALLMFGVGLLVAQYAPGLLDTDLSANYVPHGVMIGAGLVALVQAVLMMRDRKSSRETTPPGQAADVFDEANRTVDRGRLRRGLLEGLVLFVAGALLIALMGGVVSEMSGWGLVGWVLLAGAAALVHQLIVGLAAMHSGWFPAFAVTLIFLILGLVLGIPMVPLALLVGYAASTGPAFADVGFDFKAGWLLRKGALPWHPYEMAGRRQQYIAQLVGFAVAIVVVMIAWKPFFADGRVPPVAQVYVDTIKAGLTDTHALTMMVLWAIPGALIQFFGGSSRQMGVLLATGLLVATPQAGWLVLAALAVRVAYSRWKARGGGDAPDEANARPDADNDLALVGAGLVAGSSLNDVSQIYKAV
ncbi:MULTISPECIES: OPT/YSL family transporter [unclassified Streptomyces]|uniref:OPT/YSL family transporter n=1 Tax=unclassified Streptomyces TaxID=2593676 RepID=UPI0018ACD57F|nr:MULTISPECIES: OPT/YSL family transporter [unclassified Streptomyces]MBL3803156.1 OPT/YSL family transporter [Streptomyces sp. BRB081]MDQ0292193.1 putative oligopeptide transporter (OPT) family protein [Streptomyces sp. DSM 41037]